MNRRHFGLLLCAVIAIVIGARYLPFDRDGGRVGDAGSGTKGGPIERALSPAHSSGPGSIPVGSEPARVASNQHLDWNRIAAFSKGDIDAFPKLSAADCERFLAKRGETPANLVAVFDHTGDRKWLERALAAFPGSPLVLLYALSGSPDASDAQRLAWIEKLKAADPNNPIAWLLSAEALFKSGHAAEGAAEAAAALERAGFYTYSAERIAAMRALFEDGGMHPLQADLCATFSLNLQLIQTAQRTARGLEAMKSAEGENPEVIAEAGRIQYALGRMFQTPEASRNLIGQLAGISIETKGLGSQSPEIQERRKAEMESQKAEIRDLTKAASELLMSKDEERLTEYLRRYHSEGELSALRWLNARSK